MVCLDRLRRKRMEKNLGLFTDNEKDELVTNCDRLGSLTFKDAHDRFLIIDGTEIYHIGASLKDLGKKWVAFSRFESGAVEMLKKLEVKK